jgi:hypothetical protein
MSWYSRGSLLESIRGAIESIDSPKQVVVQVLTAGYSISAETCW